MYRDYFHICKNIFPENNSKIYLKLIFVSKDFIRSFNYFFQNGFEKALASLRLLFKDNKDVDTKDVESKIENVTSIYFT